MPAAKLKPVEAGDGSYGGLVLEAFDRMEAANAIPQLARGRVWCLSCGVSRQVNSAKCLRDGWPTCCGETMTIDHPMERLLRAEGYHPIRQLPSGEWAAVFDMLTTAALCVGCDESSYRTRFCYERRADAKRALREWDGAGDPPGPWVKEKGRVERLHPDFMGESWGWPA